MVRLRVPLERHGIAVRWVARPLISIGCHIDGEKKRLEWDKGVFMFFDLLRKRVEANVRRDIGSKDDELIVVLTSDDNLLAPVT